MKTPREILLNRHQTTEPRLDQIRRDVVADLRSREAARRETPLLVAVILKLWRELIVPARMTWTGIAAVWVLIGVIHLTQHDRTTTVARATSPTPQEMRAAWEQRQELMLELALLPKTEAAEPPKLKLQPRSEGRSDFACA